MAAGPGGEETYIYSLHHYNRMEMRCNSGTSSVVNNFDITQKLFIMRKMSLMVTFMLWSLVLIVNLTGSRTTYGTSLQVPVRDLLE